MKKKCNTLLAVWILLVVVAGLAGCGSEKDSAVMTHNNYLLSGESTKTSTERVLNTDMAGSGAENKHTVEVTKSNLNPSQGLEFESNGDGTCTIVGVGNCTDADIVIPDKSPDGDIVTLIGEYAFFDIEDINSITFVNYNYEVDKRAFQYGEFTALNVIGGSLVFGESAFSSCEKLTSLSFRDCNIEAGEYAFYDCGKKANVTFWNCTGIIDERAFQYADLISLTVSNCELEIEESAFSSCDKLSSIVFADSNIKVGEYAFYNCGDSAEVEMTDCSVVIDERAFQYCSLDSLTISGAKIEMENSAFSSCEDLVTVTIDCDSVALGEYTFYDCKDLISVSICENSKSNNNIEIDDRAFQYCKRLDNVIIGNSSVTIGEYVFLGCSDSLVISIDGRTFSADSIQKGLSQ